MLSEMAGEDRMAALKCGTEIHTYIKYKLIPKVRGNGPVSDCKPLTKVSVWGLGLEEGTSVTMTAGDT